MNLFATRWQRALWFGMAGAVVVVVLGKLVTLATGFHCACWIGNLRVGAQAGLVGGLVFGFIYEPNPFGPPRWHDPE